MLRRAVDETELKRAEVDVLIARVEMHKNDVIPDYQAEINKANLAEAEAKLKQLNETFALKREALAAELRILEIQRDRAQMAVAHAQSNIENMTIKSPMDGLVVLTPSYKGTRMVDPQEGDEVRSGGGIMNIMLASILGKTHEIGVRRAVGARKRDVLRKFLVEAVLISFAGGSLGVGCGFGLSRLVAMMAGWSTIVTLNSILLVFLVSVSVGLIFGIYPAAKAARLDPVEALRYE
jgi:multidrug efflux pump subunit AcrA (membrane-fusion protein)